MQHRKTYGEMSDETPFQREMRAEGIEPDFEEAGTYPSPGDLAQALADHLAHESTVAPVRETGRFASFDLHSRGGQSYRVRIEEV